MSGPVSGWVSPELRDEFPHLGLRYVELVGSPGKTPRPVRERLRVMSNRFTGGKAINTRQQPVPWAYRVFYRQIGIDPDDRRTPIEEVVLERMKLGGFVSRGLPDDALLIATVETGVGMLALDADALDGPPGLRLATAGERLGGKGRRLTPRQIVVADASRAVGVLFGDVAEGSEVRSSTRRLTVAAVRVKGVPEVSVEEALWTVVETLDASPAEPSAGATTSRGTG